MASGTGLDGARRANIQARARSQPERIEAWLHHCAQSRLHNPRASLALLRQEETTRQRKVAQSSALRQSGTVATQTQKRVHFEDTNFFTLNSDRRRSNSELPSEPAASTSRGLGCAALNFRNLPKYSELSEAERLGAGRSALSKIGQWEGSFGNMTRCIDAIVLEERPQHGSIQTTELELKNEQVRTEHLRALHEKILTEYRYRVAFNEFVAAETPLSMPTRPVMGATHEQKGVQTSEHLLWESGKTYGDSEAVGRHPWKHAWTLPHPNDRRTVFDGRHLPTKVESELPGPKTHDAATSPHRFEQCGAHTKGSAIKSTQTERRQEQDAPNPSSKSSGLSAFSKQAATLLARHLIGSASSLESCHADSTHCRGVQLYAQLGVDAQLRASPQPSAIKRVQLWCQQHPQRRTKHLGDVAVCGEDGEVHFPASPGCAVYQAKGCKKKSGAASQGDDGDSKYSLRFGLLEHDQIVQHAYRLVRRYLKQASAVIAASRSAAAANGDHHARQTAGAAIDYARLAGVSVPSPCFVAPPELPSRVVAV